MEHEENRKESMGHEFFTIAVVGPLVLTMFAPLLAFAAGRLGFSYRPLPARKPSLKEGGFVDTRSFGITAFVPIATVKRGYTENDTTRTYTCHADRQFAYATGGSKPQDAENETFRRDRLTLIQIFFTGW